ncbi:hypothetical protein F5Y11DRAFT_166077 [Daldinia sp. FL1419]|nr:hypothetical protein F5Y11DRAFT_166077 [Daldinia sp. FL1419]
MAASEIKMPAFDFTSDERVQNKDHVGSLLRDCRAFLESYRKSSSEFDLDNACAAVREALLLANEPDVCESPPLATCNLYNGHVLWIMKRYEQAKDAYLLASKIPGVDHADRRASERAVDYAMEVDQKVLEERRKGGIWSENHDWDFLDVDRHMQSSLEHNGKEWENTRSHHTYPPIKKVEAKKTTRIEAPTFFRNPIPRKAVKSDIPRVVEAAPLSPPPSPDTRKLRSMRGRNIDSGSLRMR